MRECGRFMFDFESPNVQCIKYDCQYLKKAKTRETTVNGFPRIFETYFCSINIKERFDKCPLWVNDCQRIGLFDEVRFEKVKTKELDDSLSYNVFDNWEGHLVDYLPSFDDEYRCDKFIEWLNEIWSERD